MRIWDNMDHMGDLTYAILSKGILLSAALLLIGCGAILRADLALADTCRDLSASVLLSAAVLSCCTAKRE